MSVTFSILDFETTGIEPDDQIVEVGVTQLAFDPMTLERVIGPPMAKLFKPTIPIPPQAMAVHHITNEDVAGLEPCSQGDIAAAIAGAEFVVAHNAAYEQQYMDPALLEGRHLICTYKCSLHIWPEAPAHNLQTLRYWKGLPVDEDLAWPPHRAAPDTHVTAHLLSAMLVTERVNDLVQWTKMPRLHLTCPIGDFRGKPWSEVRHDFLIWIVNKAGMEADIVAGARAEIEKRSHR
jgi:exodeoxyribonuclease X